MVLTAKGTFFSCVTNFDHKIYEILYWEHIVVQDWILRVNGLDKGPKLIDQFNIVCIHPKV